MKNQARCCFLLGILLPLLMGAANTMTDPTRPPGMISSSGELTTKPLALTAVFIYPTYKIAIIAGQVMIIGDQVGEFTVTAIRPDAVELTGPQDRKEILPLVTPVKKGTAINGQESHEVKGISSIPAERNYF